jgi:hypothetical protein
MPRGSRNLLQSLALSPNLSAPGIRAIGLSVLSLNRCVYPLTQV